MKGKKNSKPKNMDDLTKRYDTAMDADAAKEITQAEFEEALRAVSKKKRPKDAGK